jgi:hypothetical protein
MATNAPLLQPPSLFIGSSSEAVERRILNLIITSLGTTFSLRPWYEIFTQGLFTLQTLVREATQVDAALLVFTKDDEREMRGKAGSVTRDNVNVEYGLFLGTLGLSRIWILCEKGVELPTDLTGLTVRFFDGSDSNMLKSSIQSCTDEILVQWSRLPKRMPIEDRGTGLSKTLHEQREGLKTVLDRLERYSWGQPPRSESAVYFDSNRASRTTYAEALEKVEHRFWTTSYITSGFWDQSDIEDIMSANVDLLRRLSSNGGKVRRIFLLDRAPDEKAGRRKRDLIRMRREGADAEIVKFSEELERLERLNQLAELGCEIKVVYDVIGGSNNNFPYPIRFEHFDTEIAIYDDFRVDFYGGGNVRTITDIQIFTELSSNFYSVKSAAEYYFNRLWSSHQALSLQEMIHLLRSAHAYAASRIDYQSNWLARYEYDLDPADREMKNNELAAVKDILRVHGKLGNIKSMLDIGTCTARYPIEFAHDVAPAGRIVGIDNDIDCVEFSRAQQKRKTNSDRRISILDIDFTSPFFPSASLGKFELITCMLGTISHFGWDAPGGDSLGTALNRMHDLLDVNGLLFVCTWSNYALGAGSFLSIYSEKDKGRLMSWTPKSNELKKLFVQANLSVLEERQPHEFLDLFVLQRKHR